MNKILFASALSIAALVVFTTGCSSSSSAPASVSGASPNQAFAGRTLDVTLSGSATSWDGTETVTFGDGVTVNKLTLASASALVANITVADDAMIGTRDITVTKGSDSEAYKMSFQITSAIDVTVQGATAQGSIATLIINNHDVDHVFDDTTDSNGTPTNIEITAPTGMTILVGAATAFRIDAQLRFDTTVAAGKFDLDIKSGPTGSQFEFKKPGAFDIAARTAMPLSGTATFAVGQPGDSQLYSVTPGGADHLISINVTADDMNAQPIAIVLDKTGSFSTVVAAGTQFSFAAPSADPMYVILWDQGATGMYSATIKNADLALTAQSGGEGNDTSNNDPNGATALMTPPVIVKDASLSSDTDVDCFSLTVASGKSIHVLTLGAEQAATTVQFYDNAKMPIGTASDSGGPSDVTSDPVTMAGTYYVCIGTSVFFDPSASDYDLVVTLE